MSRKGSTFIRQLKGRKEENPYAELSSEKVQR